MKLKMSLRDGALAASRRGRCPRQIPTSNHVALSLAKINGGKMITDFVIKLGRGRPYMHRCLSVMLIIHKTDRYVAEGVGIMGSNETNWIKVLGLDNSRLFLF